MKNIVENYKKICIKDMGNYTQNNLYIRANLIEDKSMDMANNTILKQV